MFGLFRWGFTTKAVHVSLLYKHIPVLTPSHASIIVSSNLVSGEHVQCWHRGAFAHWLGPSFGVTLTTRSQSHFLITYLFGACPSGCVVKPGKQDLI